MHIRGYPRPEMGWHRLMLGAAAAQAQDAAQVRSWAAACANCHGTNGVAQPGNESLAGMRKETC